MESGTIGLSIASNKGLVRTSNEDNFSVNGKTRPMHDNNIHINGRISVDELSVLGVFDGMGGEELGELASDIGAQFTLKLSERLDKADKEEYPSIVNGYVQAANDEICRRLRNQDSKRGGTTFALIYIKDGMVYPYSLGDSRIYMYHDGVLAQITTDHTLAMKKYKANIYTLEEARNSSDSHKLTLFLGVDVDGDGLTAEQYKPFRLPDKGRILLCSDGLYDMCDEDTIRRILQTPSEDYSSLLLKEALDNGGIDNITCIVADLG